MESGGRYREQIVIGLCKVARIATAWRLVDKGISLWSIEFLMKIDEPPQAIRLFLLMWLYGVKFLIVKLFDFSGSLVSCRQIILGSCVFTRRFNSV